MDYEKMDKIFIRDLLVRCILGINPEERINKQDVLINLTLYTDFTRAVETEDIKNTVNYKELKQAVIKLTEESSCLLVEKLAESIAALCLRTPGVKAARVQVEKPTALRFARSVGVEIFRESGS